MNNKTIVTLSLVSLLSACGGDDGGGSTTNSAPAPAPAPAPANDDAVQQPITSNFVSTSPSTPTISASDEVAQEQVSTVSATPVANTELISIDPPLPEVSNDDHSIAQTPAVLPESSPASEAASEPEGSTPAPEPVTIQSNNLTSTYELTVDVALYQLTDVESFITICQNNQGDIDYDQCFVKASLSDGIGQYELLLPNHQQSLIIEVTPMVNGSDPLIFTWEYQPQAQNTWMIP